MGKIALFFVVVLAMPLLLPLCWMTGSKSSAVFFDEVWDQVAGDRPDFLSFVVCFGCSVLTVLGLAIVALIVAYITK